MTSQVVDVHLTIEVLPNNNLLQIFSLCNPWIHMDIFMPPVTWDRYRLAHVCQRWRYLIFASPRYLGVMLVTGMDQRRCVTTLDCWPALPIAICIWHKTDEPLSHKVEDDILAGLKHSDRIHEIILPISSSMLAKSATLVWTFPELERLDISSPDDQFTVLPHGFLGGSTPTSKKLHHITMERISFPTLPQLLMSSRDLVYLSLGPDIFTGEGFIPSDTLASSLSTATRLEFLHIYPPLGLPHKFRQICRRRRRSHILTPEQRSTHSGSSFPNLVILPSLVNIDFDGSHDYLEDLVSRIYAPFLLYITVRIHQKGTQPLHLPQLHQFLSRTECLRSLPLQTSIDIFKQHFVISHDFGSPPFGCISLTVSFYDHEYWDMSQVDHFSRQLHPLISSVKRVRIHVYSDTPSLQGEPHTHTVQWLRLFMLFNGAQDVQVYNVNESYTGIAKALQKSTEIGQKVFPALRILRLCGFGKKTRWRIKVFLEEH
jgi:F-box-like